LLHTVLHSRAGYEAAEGAYASWWDARRDCRVIKVGPWGFLSTRVAAVTLFGVCNGA